MDHQINHQIGLNIYGFPLVQLKGDMCLVNALSCSPPSFSYPHEPNTGQSRFMCEYRSTLKTWCVVAVALIACFGTPDSRPGYGLENLVPCRPSPGRRLFEFPPSRVDGLRTGLAWTSQVLIHLPCQVLSQIHFLLVAV